LRGNLSGGAPSVEASAGFADLVGFLLDMGDHPWCGGSAGLPGVNAMMRRPADRGHFVGGRRSRSDC
jgi:hypothetical protein